MSSGRNSTPDRPCSELHISAVDREAWKVVRAYFLNNGAVFPLGICVAMVWSKQDTPARKAQLRTWMPRQLWHASQIAKASYWWDFDDTRSRLRVLDALCAGKIGPYRPTKEDIT